ncbi:unnamed protein product [Prunus brigantina]
MEGYGSSSRYDALNDINKKNHATDVGISSSRSSDDVDWSDAGGGGQGKVPKGGGHNIRSNTIEGEGAEKGFHNFRNGSEDDGGRSNYISENKIRARNGASNVGMSNFHNQDGEGGGEGKKPKSVVGHNICDNKISADTSMNVGLHDFGNIK